MKKRILYILFLITCGLFLHCGQQQKADVQVASTASKKSTAITSVEVIHPSIQSFNSNQIITGTLKPDKSIFLHAMESGKLISLKVDIGDKVSKGQLIARLSNPLLNFKVKEAEANILQAKAKLKNAEAGLELQKSNSSAAQKIYDNLQSIYEESKGLITITELDNAERDAAVANSEIAASSAKIEEANAAIHAAKVMLSAIKERFEMLKITAPFSGIITGRFADPGAMIQNALTNNDAKPLVSIESVDPVRLSLPIPESDISGIQAGDDISIEFPSLAEAAVQSKISRISRSLDPASKTLEVQVDLSNKEGKLKAGMYAKAEIKRASSKDILSLPHTAINMRKDAAFVYMVSDDIVQEIPLKKGLSGKNYFEVLNDNITPASQIIIKGKSMVKAGQKVKAVLK